MSKNTTTGAKSTATGVQCSWPGQSQQLVTSANDPSLDPEVASSDAATLITSMEQVIKTALSSAHLATKLSQSLRDLARAYTKHLEYVRDSGVSLTSAYEEDQAPTVLTYPEWRDQAGWEA